jgi:hypothetical protein
LYSADIGVESRRQQNPRELLTGQWAWLGNASCGSIVGIHTNMPATVPADLAKALQFGDPPPSGLSADERHAYDQLDFFYKHGRGCAQEMINRPQTLYGIGDSPVGLAAWMLDHDARSYALIARVFDGQREELTRDDVLDNVTVYWLTNTTISSALCRDPASRFAQRVRRDSRTTPKRTVGSGVGHRRLLGLSGSVFSADHKYAVRHIGPPVLGRGSQRTGITSQ